MDKDNLRIIKLALKEDIGKGDITTNALFPKPMKVTAKIIARESGVICGLCAVSDVFKMLDRRIQVIRKADGGSKIKKGQVVCIIKGDARKILAGERTALNFLGRLSGIATLTNKYVEKVKPYKVKILDTRKTAPGLRELEKYAVKCGGGTNHRAGLYDQILIKDNHLKVLSIACLPARQGYRVLSIKNMIKQLRKKTNKKIEIEVENLREFKKALDAGPNIIMLDNIGISDIKKAVAFRNTLYPIPYTPRPELEVSGGVSLDNVRSIAATGVDMISVGALTHSAPSIDFSLEIVWSPSNLKARAPSPKGIK